MIGAERAVDKGAGNSEVFDQGGKHIFNGLFRGGHLLGDGPHVCRLVGAVESIEVVPLGCLCYHYTRQWSDVGHAEIGGNRVKVDVVAGHFEDEGGLQVGGVEGERTVASGGLLQFSRRVGRILQIDHLEGKGCADCSYTCYFVDRCRRGARSGRWPPAATSCGHRNGEKQHGGQQPVYGSTHFLSFCRHLADPVKNGSVVMAEKQKSREPQVD